MAGRPRLPISTFGSIKTAEVGPGRFRAWTRFRDWDGETRQVTATGSSRSAAKTALKVDLAARMSIGRLARRAVTLEARPTCRHPVVEALAGVGEVAVPSGRAEPCWSGS